MWLYQSLDDMDSRLRRAHRDEILSCLHSIPSYLRPQYSTRSLQACRTPLLLHILSRIWYLGSLSDHSFFQVLFSIFPFHNNTSLSRDVLTAHIISAEYGDSDRSGYCVGTDAAILAYYLRILNTKCTLLIKLQPMFNISLES